MRSPGALELPCLRLYSRPRSSKKRRRPTHAYEDTTLCGISRRKWGVCTRGLYVLGAPLNRPYPIPCRPAWVTSITDPTELKTVLKNHINAVMGRYGNDLYAFDVVNEREFVEDVKAALYAHGHNRIDSSLRQRHIPGLGVVQRLGRGLHRYRCECLFFLFRSWEG